MDRQKISLTNILPPPPSPKKKLLVIVYSVDCHCFVNVSAHNIGISCSLLQNWSHGSRHAGIVNCTRCEWYFERDMRIKNVSFCHCYKYLLLFLCLFFWFGKHMCRHENCWSKECIILPLLQVFISCFLFWFSRHICRHENCWNKKFIKECIIWYYFVIVIYFFFLPFFSNLASIFADMRNCWTQFICNRRQMIYFLNFSKFLVQKLWFPFIPQS